MEENISVLEYIILFYINNNGIACFYLSINIKNILVYKYLRYSTYIIELIEYLPTILYTYLDKLSGYKEPRGILYFRVGMLKKTIYCYMYQIRIFMFGKIHIKLNFAIQFYNYVI